MTETWLRRSDQQLQVSNSNGYTRYVPFGCYEDTLLTWLYFEPGQALASHRHRDSDEYFTAVRGDADMLVECDRVRLPEGATFLRRRGVLHAIRNSGNGLLVVQSFQSPIPRDDETCWEPTEGWNKSSQGCPRCWCGQIGPSGCENCHYQA